MKLTYRHTISACFIGYIVQAIVNNFAPLLFLTFQTSYHIPLTQITMLVTVNFGVQLLVDLLSAGFVDKIGYRVSMGIAHLTAALGLVLLAVLPDLLPSPFFGLDVYKRQDRTSRTAAARRPSRGPRTPAARRRKRRTTARGRGFSRTSGRAGSRGRRPRGNRRPRCA